MSYMEKYLEFTKKLAKEAEEIALRYFSFEVENTWKLKYLKAISSLKKLRK